MEVVKLKFEGKYVDHNVKANKSAMLQFKMPYTELVNYVQSVQMLNENVTVGVKVGADKPVSLGTFMMQNLNIDRDGEGKMKFNSQLDFIDGNALNELAMRSDEPLIILLKAEIDTEDESDSEENESEDDE